MNQNKKYKRLGHKIWLSLNERKKKKKKTQKGNTDQAKERKKPQLDNQTCKYKYGAK